MLLNSLIQHRGCHDALFPPRNVKKLWLHGAGVLFLLLFLCIALGPTNDSRAQSDAATLTHTSPTINKSCKQMYFSQDDNPFPLCPGPFPRGGNCTWWAWEQWHMLGYDLPLNWGNAADWVVDAERAGLPVGTQPRVGAIAVFPRSDGYWAFSSDGHVAFVTSVSPDGGTFNVTYENYGDSTPIHVGVNYAVDLINAPNYQRDQLRFIYFPFAINAARFARLPGINGNDLSGIALANAQLGDSYSTLGLPGGSPEQEFNADFTGNGLSDLLLYNRQQGSLSVVSLSQRKSSGSRAAQHVVLSDSQTSANGWGSTLDVRVGDFAGTGKSDILLYDRANGTIQILILTSQLTIEKHIALAGWGPNWELYAGRFDGQRTGLFMYNRFTSASIPAWITNSTKEGNALQQWIQSGRTASAFILDFNSDLSVRHLQEYTQWHNSWEVYVGSYKSANQDGVFLYDRANGEARVMDFNANMTINDYQAVHNLSGNWQVFSGDFNGSGHAQVMLYDPSRGAGAFLIFNSALSLLKRQDYTGWKSNAVLYMGQFGTNRLNVMLYDPQKGVSTFIAFDNALNVADMHTVQSWDQHWQILVGAFVDRSSCIASGSCSKGDDILVLNRKTGQIKQYIFTFGRQYQVVDNRMRPFSFNGASSSGDLKTVDTTSFRTVGTYTTTIRGEELY